MNELDMKNQRWEWSWYQTCGLVVLWLLSLGTTFVAPNSLIPYNKATLVLLEVTVSMTYALTDVGNCFNMRICLPLINVVSMPMALWWYWFELPGTYSSVGNVLTSWTLINLFSCKEPKGCILVRNETLHCNLNPSEVNKNDL